MHKFLLALFLLPAAVRAHDTRTIANPPAVPLTVKATINVQSVTKLPDESLEIVASDGTKGSLKCTHGSLLSVSSPGIEVKYLTYKFVTHDLPLKTENEAIPTVTMKADDKEKCAQALETLRSNLENKQANLVIGVHDHSTGAFKLILNGKHPVESANAGDPVEGSR